MKLKRLLQVRRALRKGWGGGGDSATRQPQTTTSFVALGGPGGDGDGSDDADGDARGNDDGSGDWIAVAGYHLRRDDAGDLDVIPESATSACAVRVRVEPLRIQEGRK